MKKLFFAIQLILLLILMIVSLTSCGKSATEVSSKPSILVSIDPLQYLVEKIAGDEVNITVLVPPGGNPHAFEPSPRQLLNAGSADIWFRIGEPFEERAGDVLKSHRPTMLIVDTRNGVDLISYSGKGCCHCCQPSKFSDDKDTHIWLSPRSAKIQAKTIANALINRYPEYQEKFENNLEACLVELDTLDSEIRTMFASQIGKTILVAHPAFAYFCRDYGLSQLSIEFEGKDPSPQQLTTLLTTARQLKIGSVFTQDQYQNKGALLIAKELGANVFSIDPYSRDYVNNLRKIAALFAAQKESSDNDPSHPD